MHIGHIHSLVICKIEVSFVPHPIWRSDLPNPRFVLVPLTFTSDIQFEGRIVSLDHKHSMYYLVASLIYPGANLAD